MIYSFPIKQRLGFTLTELAITLGVTGVIIAATWSAFGEIRENMQSNRNFAILTQVVNDIQTFYSDRPPANMPVTNMRITRRLNTLRLFPDDVSFVDTGDPATDRFETVYNSLIQVSLSPSGSINNRGAGFIIDFSRLSSAQCVRLAMNIIQNRNNKLAWMRINSDPDYDPIAAPPSDIQVAAKCNENAQAALGVGYTF